MAIVNGLCTLADVKSLAGITDTSQDARLELLINGVSAQVSDYCQRNFQKTTYTNETYSCPNRQLLLLRNMPIVSVTSVTFDGNLFTAGTDYVVTPEYQSWGALYREPGWIGYPINREYLTTDPVSGKRVIVVTYIAGYLLPADAGYTAGASTSLPMDLQYAVQLVVLAAYVQARKNNFDGLASMTEGGLAYSWLNAANQNTNNNSGFQLTPGAILNRYKRTVVTA